MKIVRNRKKSDAKFRDLVYEFHTELKRQTDIFMDAYRRQVEKGDK